MVTGLCNSLLLSSCAHSRAAESVADQNATNARELDFWEGLEQKSLLTNHDAIHGLLLLADGTDERAGWSDRLAAARARGWVGAHESLDPNETATIGMVSVAVFRILQLDGGVNVRLFGPTPRACTRELVFHELLPTRSSQQALRGLEFLDLAGRVDDWRASHGGAVAGGARR
jgi:hypothetical protein